MLETSIVDAKNRLTRLIRRAENGETVHTGWCFKIVHSQLQSIVLLGSVGCHAQIWNTTINLRLKGPCIFWYRENAEKMLMLRSYYKAGRWKLLKRMANSHLSLLAA